MSDSVWEAHVERFTSQVHYLGQQQRSRLFGYTRQENGVGEKFAFERVKAQDMQAKGPRHEDTPILNVEHSRRYALPQTWKWGDATDSDDQVRTLIDINNSYVQTAGMAHGRKLDELILGVEGGAVATEGGALGPAKEGDRTTTTALPAGQNIYVGGHVPGSPTSTDIMSVDVLRQVKKKLDQSEIWGERVLALSAEQYEQLLADPEFTSADYNFRKPLAEAGGPETASDYLGFRIKQTELGPKTGNARQAVAYVDRAVGLAIADYKRSFVQRDPSLSFAWRIYCELTIGAVRIEDEGVVAVHTYEA